MPEEGEPGTHWQLCESWLYVHWFILRFLRPQIHHQALLLPESVKGGLWLNFICLLVQTSGFGCGGVIWNNTSLLDSVFLAHGCLWLKPKQGPAWELPHGAKKVLFFSKQGLNNWCTILLKCSMEDSGISVPHKDCTRLFMLFFCLCESSSLLQRRKQSWDSIRVLSWVGHLALALFLLVLNHYTCSSSLNMTAPPDLFWPCPYTHFLSP